MEATPAQVVAGNVHTARAQRGLTLAELAKSSGVAKGTIASVESGTANPTIDTLSALADALALPLTDLITATPARASVVRRTQPVRRPLDQQCVARMSYSISTEVWHLRLQAGHGVEREPHAPGTIEIILVHAGALRCGPIEEAVSLATGDSLTYGADCRHEYLSQGDDDADATVVMLMPLWRGNTRS